MVRPVKSVDLGPRVQAQFAASIETKRRAAEADVVVEVRTAAIRRLLAACDGGNTGALGMPALAVE